MADKQISDLTSATVLTDGSLFVIEQGGAAKSANWGMIKEYISPSIAPQYSNSSTYAVGDYVIYNGSLYRCVTAITSAEAWTAAHWTQEILGDNVADIQRQFDNVTSDTINIWNEKWGIGVLANDGSVNPSPSPLQIVSKDKIPCSGNTMYYAKTPSGNSIRIAQYKSDETFISFVGYKENQTFTTDANAAFLMFNTAGPSVSEYAHNISINRLVGDYQKYYPHITAVDGVSRQKIDNICQNTGNLWDEEIDPHKYINNSGVEASASSSAWCATNYIEVSPSTQYYICVTDGTSCRVAQYDVNKVFKSFLGYLGNETFTTGSDIKYIRFWKGGSDTYVPGVAIYIESSGQKAYLPYKSAVDYVARDKVEKDEYIIIGQGQDYTTVVSGFAAAIAQDKGCIILPGVYDLVSEGASSGIGITAPKRVVGYGAKIVASLPSEDWDYSAINISKTMDEVIIEGVEIEVTNCRYCVHDEEYDRVGYYHHVFKNCKMKHNSSASATLIRPICIGGGFGNKCLVEIENCDFYSHDANNNDVNYHANALGQSGDCVVKCKDSIFETSIGITGNAQTGFVNQMYVCGCLCGSAPVNPDTANSKLTQWNNTVR